MDGWIKTLDRAAKAFATELGAGVGVSLGLGLGMYVLSFIGVDWTFLLADVSVPGWVLGLGLILFLGRDKS